MQLFFDWCYQQSFATWCLISLASNAVTAGLSILGCWLVSRHFRLHRIFEAPQPITRSDVLYSFSAVFFNSAVAVIGWILWKQGWIILHHASFLWALGDALGLIVVMDFAMYVFHRLAHHPLLFRIVHASHHKHESTNPLSLFVLNPFEVLGFGSLLVIALVLFPVSAEAVFAYLSLNLLFGTIGHLGVEIFPQRLMRLLLFRYLGTSTFHGMHHADRSHNFGFYTTIWDHLFKTIRPNRNV